MGPAPRPLALSTSTLPPTFCTPVGYQAVGIRPRTRLPARSTTATSLSPEFATYRVRPSGERASPSGLAPTGACGYGASEIVVAVWLVRVSMTLISSLSPPATYSRCVAASRTAWLGWVPTGMVLRTDGVAPLMSTALTVLAP